MRRPLALLASAVFLIIAPGLVAGFIPWWICRWHFGPAVFGDTAVGVLGVALIAGGMPVLLDSFARFAVQGVGTPAPVFPTEQLVITGWFRYVRNPMYLAILALVFGQGLLFRNVRVLEYGAGVAAAFCAFVLLYEEPTLRHRFGREYDEFCAHVPRWIPRLSPWRKPMAQ